MKIEMKGKTVRLATAGCYCAENIDVSARLQDKTATANGEVVADSGYTGLGKVTVAVPAEVATLQEKKVNISENGTTEVTADSGNDGLSKVTVTVAVPETVPKLQEKTLSVAANGTTVVTADGDYDGLSSVTVDVNIASSGGGSVPGGYSVTFMSGNTMYASASVVAGNAVNAPSDPTRDGATFLGWVDADNAAVQFPYTPTKDTTFYANFATQIVLGFTGLTGSSGALTLTDDVAGYAAYTTAASGSYVNVTNPLDNVFPYNQIEEFTDTDGNVFVKYPKFYMKWVLNSSGVIDGWKISNQKVDDTYFLPDAFLSPSGAENDYFALGKYEMSGSSSKGYSKSGVTCLVNITRADARSAARAYGTSSDYYKGYQQLDIAQYVAYNFLCMMYYRTANIQTVYGGRTGSVSSWSSASVTGTCDGVNGMNGWNASTDCVKMLGIENPYGNIWKWVDGIYFFSSEIYYHRMPQNYADSTTAASKLSFSRPTSSGYVSALRPGTTAATQSCVYASAASGSASTYYGDYSWYSSSGVVLNVGGTWYDASLAGLWCLGGNGSASGAYSDVGARLSYRPL